MCSRVSSLKQPHQVAFSPCDERQELAPDGSDVSAAALQSATAQLCALSSVTEDGSDALAAWICRQNIMRFEKRLQACDHCDVNTLTQLLAEEKIRLKALRQPR